MESHRSGFLQIYLMRSEIRYFFPERFDRCEFESSLSMLNQLPFLRLFFELRRNIFKSDYDKMIGIIIIIQMIVVIS